MKKTTLVSSETHLHTLRRSARRFRSCFALSPLVLAAAALLGPGGGGFGEAMANSFQPIAGDEPDVRSFGVFRIEVLAKFQPMLQGTGLGYSLYWGYNANGSFTSPLLQDKMGLVSCPPSGSPSELTWIGYSKAHCEAFGVPALSIANPLEPMQICSATAPFSTPGGLSVATASYSEFDATPLSWVGSSGHNEIFTYMINLELCGYTNCAYSAAVPPAPYDSQCPMVFTGIKKYPYIHKSIGRTISRTIPVPACDSVTGAATAGWNDYDPQAGAPYAKSFWDMYVYVHIPAGPGTDVPGFFLYNDPADLDAMLIENNQVETLPPNPVYIHGGSTSVPFKMVNAGSDASGTITWAAGEVFGNLKLAGHQINLVCAKSTDVTAFLTNVLGTDKAQKAGPPTLWAFPGGNLFPSSGASYRSVPGTNFQGGSASQVDFTNSTTTISVRSLKKGNFPNPIAPPAPNSTATYSTLTSADTLEISMDGATFYPATGSGPFETAITWLTSANNTTTYDLKIHSRTNTYSSPLGGFKLRESPTLSSVGQHIIKTTSSTTKTASFFDVWLEINMGGGQPWLVANRSIRMEVTEPACGTPGNISATINGNFVTLTWGGGNFRLQRSSSLVPGNWVDVTGVSPITLPITGLSFFRLVCP